MDLLMQGESLFSFVESLDLDFVPKVIPHREAQQGAIADSIRPLIDGFRGRHVLVTGKAGVGKTVTVKRMLSDLGEEHDVLVSFVNCWKKNSSFKVLSDVCHQLGYQFTHNLGTDEVLSKIGRIVGSKGLVLALDEVDKCQDNDYLYYLSEEIPKLVLVMITNERNWFAGVDQRIRSRVVPEHIEFKPYSLEEMAEVLGTRRDYAFYSGAWDAGAFSMVVDSAFEEKDVRRGMALLRESGIEAEKNSSRIVLPEHVKKAISRTESVKAPLFDEDESLVLKAVEKVGEGASGDVYTEYSSLGGTKSMRTFDRKVKALEDKGFLVTERTGKGFRGQSTLIRFSGFKPK